MAHPVDIRPGSSDDIDALEPLWVAVHHRHAASMPELAPYVDEKSSWAVRRDLYTQLLADPDNTLLLATVDGALVGYGLSHVTATTETWVADTWRTGARIGEIESLGVLPAYRNSGIGSRLLGQLIDGLQAIGVEDLVIGVLAGNDSAARLYQRHGFRPTWTYLSRFDGR